MSMAITKRTRTALGQCDHGQVVLGEIRSRPQPSNDTVPVPARPRGSNSIAPARTINPLCDVKHANPKPSLAAPDGLVQQAAAVTKTPIRKTMARR